MLSVVFLHSKKTRWLVLWLAIHVFVLSTDLGMHYGGDLDFEVEIIRIYTNQRVFGISNFWRFRRRKYLACRWKLYYTVWVV